MKPCAHMDFRARVDVGRLTEAAPEGVDAEDLDPHSFIAEVEVRCTECGELFGFKGVDTGYDTEHPTQGLDGTKVVLPLRTPAELILAGGLPGLSLEGRQVARGVRAEVKAGEEGEGSAVLDAARAMVAGWLALYREGLATGLGDLEAQRRADEKLEEELGG